MKKEELLKLLEENGKDNGDHEQMHANCDEALLQYIDDNEIRAAYDKGTKWYA